MFKDEMQDWFHERRYSRVTDINPDPKIFPNFYKAKRIEINLVPGQMVFIPAGMFHFVFSKDPDPETGLCVGVNFWYDHSHGKDNDEGDPNELPQVGWHDLETKFNDILSIIKSKKNIKVQSSSNNVFPPRLMKRYFPDIEELNMTFEEFYKRKNIKDYIAQFKSTELDKFAIPYKNSLKDSSIWINWGNVNTIPHYDGMDNWFCQIKGTRRVILIPQNERDLLYLFNPYPLKFIFNIKKIVDSQLKKSNEFFQQQNIDSQIKKSSEFFHQKNRIIDEITINNILNVNKNDNEYIISCNILEHSYVEELDIKELEGYPTISHPKWISFKVKKYNINDEIPAFKYMGILWFLTDAAIKIGENVIDKITKGSVISFLENFPVKILTECILITPHGFNED